MDRLPIVRPQFPALASLSDQLSAALESGLVTNNGPLVQQFEAALTEYLGVPTIVFCNGETALMAALKAVGVWQDDVLCPSLTFAGTPHAIRWAGGWPKFCDIREDTLCIDPDAVRHKLTDAVRCIVGVDPYGICCDYTALHSIGREARVPVVIDSAPAFGSTVGGKVTGGFCDAQVFSFHATKPFSTMEGGALCSADRNLIDRAKTIRNFGQEADGNCLMTGLNGKMMEVCALVGLENLKTWPERAHNRIMSAMALRAAVDAIPGLRSVQPPADQSPIWTYQPVLVEDDFVVTRNEVIERLKPFGVTARAYYSPPCHLMACYGAKYGVNLPVTEDIVSRVIALPVYDAMTDAEIDQIARALRSIKLQGGG